MDSNIVWFGRDAFGRSLLVHWPTTDDPHTIFGNWKRGWGGRGAGPPELQRKTLLLFLSSTRAGGGGSGHRGQRSRHAVEEERGVKLPWGVEEWDIGRRLASWDVDLGGAWHQHRQMTWSRRQPMWTEASTWWWCRATVILMAKERATVALRWWREGRRWWHSGRFWQPDGILCEIHRVLGFQDAVLSAI
jgi:hypothetical protein